MSDWQLQHPVRLGTEGDVTASLTRQARALGDCVQAKHKTNGSLAEFIYLKAEADITQYAWLYIDPLTFVAAPLDTDGATNAISGNLVACSQIAITGATSAAPKFFYAILSGTQFSGLTTESSVAVGDEVVATSTAGQVAKGSAAALTTIFSAHFASTTITSSVGTFRAPTRMFLTSYKEAETA